MGKMTAADWEEFERKLDEREKRARTKIVYSAPDIRYLIDGVEAARQQLSDLQRLIIVRAGLDYMGTDMEVRVLDFGASLWIVPDTIRLRTFADWAEYLYASRGLYWARIAAPPRAWMGGGWLGLGRHPVAKVLVGGKLPTMDPTWECDGPLNPKD